MIHYEFSAQIACGGGPMCSFIPVNIQRISSLLFCSRMGGRLSWVRLCVVFLSHYSKSWDRTLK